MATAEKNTQLVDEEVKRKRVELWMRETDKESLLHLVGGRICDAEDME